MEWLQQISFPCILRFLRGKLHCKSSLQSILRTLHQHKIHQISQLLEWKIPDDVDEPFFTQCQDGTTIQLLSNWQKKKPILYIAWIDIHFHMDEKDAVSNKKRNEKEEQNANKRPIENKEKTLHKNKTNEPLKKKQKALEHEKKELVKASKKKQTEPTKQLRKSKRLKIKSIVNWSTTELEMVKNNVWDKLHVFRSIQNPKRSQALIYQEMEHIYTQALQQGVQIPPNEMAWNSFLKLLYSFPPLQCEVVKQLYIEPVDVYLSLAHYAHFLPSDQKRFLQDNGTNINRVTIPARPWTFHLQGCKDVLTENMDQPLFLQLCLFASQHKRKLHFEMWQHIEWDQLAFRMLTNCFLGDQIPLQTQFVKEKEKVTEPFSKFAEQLCSTLFQDGQPICIAQDKFHIGQMFYHLKVPPDAHGFGCKTHVWLVREQDGYYYVTFPRKRCITYIPSSDIPSLDFEDACRYFFKRPNMHFVASHQGKSIIAVTGQEDVQYKIISHKKTNRMRSIQLLIWENWQPSHVQLFPKKYKVQFANEFKEPDYRQDTNQYIVLCDGKEWKKWKHELPEASIIRLSSLP
jgi:hypothetical protein